MDIRAALLHNDVFQKQIAKPFVTSSVQTISFCSISLHDNILTQYCLLFKKFSTSMCLYCLCFFVVNGYNIKVAMWTNFKCTVLRHEAHTHSPSSPGPSHLPQRKVRPHETLARRPSPSPLYPPPSLVLMDFTAVALPPEIDTLLIFCSSPGPCLGRCCFVSAEELVCFLPVQGLSCQGLTALTLPDSDALFCLPHGLLAHRR